MLPVLSSPYNFGRPHHSTCLQKIIGDEVRYPTHPKNITFATMFKNNIFILLLLASLVMASCSNHQKILKSTDNEAKYEKAMEYYEKGDYYRALQVFEQLMPIYRGTAKPRSFILTMPMPITKSANMSWPAIILNALR